MAVESFDRADGVECCDNCEEPIEECACCCIECGDTVADCACELGPAYDGTPIDDEED